MKVYKTTSKVLGYKIGLHNDYLYVAVPKKYFRAGSVLVVSDDKSKIFTLEDKEMESVFKDKYDSTKDYPVVYFLWER